MSYKPEISVVTASYNRSKYLKKLIKSLSEQSYKNFEWIIGNDGSEDDTDEIIKNEKNNLKFNITYVKSTHRIGKAKMDNYLFEHTNGKYICYSGSDDYFTPSALKDLVDLISTIPSNEKVNYSGVMGQSVDLNGISQTFFSNQVPNKEITLKYEDLVSFSKGDGTILEYAENYKNKKYREVDLVISEGSMLSKIYCGKNFLITPKIVRVMERANDSISFGNKMQYSRGSAYCIADIENSNKFSKYDLLKKIKLLLNYWRYSHHGDINFFKAKEMWEVTNKKYLPVLLYPISLIICIRDKLLGKVEKTHLIFDENIKKFDITVEKFLI